MESAAAPALRESQAADAAVDGRNPPQSHQKRRLAVNFFFLSAGEMTAKLLTFASFSYLARVLGPTNYGFLEFALAVMVFFSLPADMGLGAYGAREIAREPANASNLLHAVTGLRMVLALCSMLVLGIFIIVINKSGDLKWLLTLYGVSLLGGPFLLQWFFQAHEGMHWVGIASIVRQAGFAILVFLACRRGSPLLYIGIIECASVAAVALYCTYVTRRMGYGWPWPDLRIGTLLSHLGEAVPIGLTEVAWAFMWYFCTVLLGLIFSDRNLGWFGASHRVLMALNTFVWLYFFNLLPSISRCVIQPSGRLTDLIDGSVRFTAWTGLFGAAVLMVISPDALGLVYGKSFRGASSSFSILVWMLPVALISGHYRYILIAYRRQTTLLRCTVVSALAAVLLGIALVPLYGGVGASWALLIALVINLVLVYFAVRGSIAELRVAHCLAAPVSALALSASCYAVLRGTNLWLALAAGISVYLAVLAFSDGPRLASFARNLIGPVITGTFAA